MVEERGVGAGSRDPGFGVYVHWPFCAQKCPYCDFNSHVRPGGWDEVAFLSAFTSEIANAAQRTGPRNVGSVFFGGGTPSLMQTSTVEAILSAIAAAWSLDASAEITLEANPGSVEAERFRGYRAAGVNRVSLGVQSLRENDLRALGRIHSVDEAKAALKIAASVFDRMSFDLIYARPRQTVVDWREELGEALAMASDAGHLSLYQLTIEPDTPFERWHKAGKLIVPDGEASLEFYEATQELTEAAGLPAYETSNHARPGQESRHNLVYWRYGEYAGVGPGAHGRIIENGRRMATSTQRQPEAWAALVEAAGHGLVEAEVLSRAEMADEMLLMGLRLMEGVDVDRLAELSGFVPGEAAIDDLRAEGLLERFQADDGSMRLRAVGQGRFVLNALVVKLSAAFEPVCGQ